MNPKQRATAERLVADQSSSNLEWSRQVVALLRELAAEPVQEPVAWHVCSVNSDGSLSLEFAAPWEEAAHEHINDAINEYDIDDAASWVVRPVYASPQPQRTEPPQDMPQQRKPLTDKEIMNTLKAQGTGIHWRLYVETVRAVERAHGITGEPT